MINDTQYELDYLCSENQQVSGMPLFSAAESMRDRGKCESVPIQLPAVTPCFCFCAVSGYHKSLEVYILYVLTLNWFMQLWRNAVLLFCCSYDLKIIIKSSANLAMAAASRKSLTVSKPFSAPASQINLGLGGKTLVLKGKVTKIPFFTHNFARRLSEGNLGGNKQTKTLQGDSALITFQSFVIFTFQSFVIWEQLLHLQKCWRPIKMVYEK